MNAEQRIRLFIGDMVVANASLMAQLEECQKEIAELKAKILPEKTPAKKQMLGFGALGEFALGQGPAVMPTIGITGTMSARETKDTFLGGALSWNRVNSAEIGVIDTSSPDVEIGVAIRRLARVRVSIRMA